MKCIALDDCLEDGQPKKGGYCEGHAKQSSRGEPLTPLRDYDRSAEEVLIDAAIDLGNADSEDDGSYARLRKYVLVCAVRYTLVSRGLCAACGKRPARKGLRKCARCGKADAERAARWQRKRAMAEKASEG